MCIPKGKLWNQLEKRGMSLTRNVQKAFEQNHHTMDDSKQALLVRYNVIYFWHVVDIVRILCKMRDSQQGKMLPSMSNLNVMQTQRCWFAQQ